ncbi:MAG: Sua5/YciO/YrdC/YwlC family protein, partial [Muribaculum sp.]|nr:Sua5/YciO/YrdC/YwlC family protein [Muribaculum sp.]
PTTVILNNVKSLAPNLLAPDGSAGIRVTSEPFSATLCRTFGRPVVSTSANLSGQLAPALFSEISNEIINGVDYVCNTRRDDTTRALPSIVVRINNDGTPIFLRR